MTVRYRVIALPIRQVTVLCTHQQSYETQAIIRAFQHRGVSSSAMLYRDYTGQLIGKLEHVFLRAAGVKYDGILNQILRDRQALGFHHWFPDQENYRLPYNWRSKGEMMQRYLDVPMLNYPPSFIAEQAETVLKKVEAGGLSFPLQLKPFIGSHGEGQKIIYSLRMLQRWLFWHAKDIPRTLFQNFYAGNVYRVVVIGGQVSGIFAYGNKITSKLLKDQAEQVALRGTQVLQADIAGVDILVDTEQVPRLLEVNLNPQFQLAESRFPVAQPMVDFYLGHFGYSF